MNAAFYTPKDPNQTAILSGQPLRFDKADSAARRTLRAEWLQKAALAGVPVILENAIITGSLLLKNVVLKEEFSLVDCGIHASVNFSYATFTRNASFAGSGFSNSTVFVSATAERDLRLSRAHFLCPGRALFNKLDVWGTLHAKVVVFAQDVQASFAEARFRGKALFHESRFGNDVDFSYSKFDSAAEFQGAEFLGDANFEEAQILGPARFDSPSNGPANATTFQHGAKFTGVLIASDAKFENAQFKSGPDPVTFENAVLKGNARFISVLFNGEVLFAGAQINGQAIFSGAVFKGKVSFNSARIGHTASFTSRFFPPLEGAVFHKKADFGSLRVGSHLQCNDVVFHGDASFNGARVEDAVFFRGAKFDQEANFVALSVRTNVEFQGACFGGPCAFDLAIIGGFAHFHSRPDSDRPFVIWKDTVTFYGATFKSSAHFAGARFCKQANLRSVDFRKQAVFWGVRFDDDAHFIGCRFGELVDFGGWIEANERLPAARFSKSVLFDHARFDSDAKMAGVVFEGPTSFRETQFRVWFLSDGTDSTVNAEFRDTVDLRGCTYERLSADWRTLFFRPGYDTRLSVFDRQPYAQLEHVLRRTGEDKEADDVHFERWRAERKTKYRQPSLLGLGYWLYQIVAGYGVKRWRLVVYAAVFLFFGAAVFSIPDAVDDRIAQSSLDLSYWEALGLSLREFFPFTLPFRPSWTPAARLVELPYTNRYIDPQGVATSLRISGLVFVPLFIAALTGILRRIQQA